MSVLRQIRARFMPSFELKPLYFLYKSRLHTICAPSVASWLLISA